MVEEVKKEILIIGADSMLGKALMKEVSKSFSVRGTTIDELDITDEEKVRKTCSTIRPKIIVLLAAYTDVDGCEENADLTFRVNIEGVKNVALVANKIKAVLIFMSSDYIFDGETDSAYKEDDQPNPISAYGQSKLDGEKIIQSKLEKFVIVRSSWLFGEGKKGFIQVMLEAIRHKKPLRVVSDKIGSPTYAVDLATAISKIISLIIRQEYDFKKNNIVHITNQGACSWFDMAKYMIDYLKADGIVLSKISLSQYPFKAKRPRYSPLDNGRYKKITGAYLRPWQEALGEFVECQKV